jgi:hypothetical protein
MLPEYGVRCLDSGKAFPFTFASILCVNKQLHEEAAIILYEQNTFLAMLSTYRRALSNSLPADTPSDSFDTPTLPPEWGLSRMRHVCVGLMARDQELTKPDEYDLTDLRYCDFRYEALQNQRLTN